MRNAKTYTDDQYVQKLIDDKEKKLIDDFKKARAYLESQKFFEKDFQGKIDFLLTDNGLLLLEAVSGKKMSVTKMSELFKITQNDFHDMMRDNPEIYDSVDRGRLKDIDDVEQALFKMAKGYYVTEKKEKFYPNERNGTTTVITESLERYRDPNYNAVAYVLNNKRQKEYHDRQKEIEIAKNTIKVEIEIIGDDEINLE